jgi:putative NIF3 family GTP cyclohydrolase 1 type 2
MKLSHFYNQVVKFGKELDPRGKANVVSYEDTAILYGDPETEVRKIMVGVDMEVGELLLADKLRQKEGLDLVISHHPEGKAYAHFYEVMRLQVAMLVKVGIPKAVAEKLIEERKFEVERRVLAANHTRSVDAARLLDMPFMCMHTPADNHVNSFLQKLMDKGKPKKVSDIVDILLNIPEYQDALDNNAGPRVILGNRNNPAGKILLEMTGGTEGSREVFGKIYKSGVRTLVSMHLGEDHLKKVKDANLNVVIAGHISSDNLGLNLLLDNIEKEERLETIGCSGFRRIRHNS